MKKLIYIVLFLAAAKPASSQTLEKLIQKVEQNNLQLKAMQKWLEAERTSARTGIYPDNPEATYVYLWGNSEALANQQEFEFIQSFKMPGYYSSKSDIQKQDVKHKEIMVQKASQEILHQVRVGYFNLAWLTKKALLLQKRTQESEKLVSIMKQGFESGEFSKPAYDKARIYSLGLNNELQKIISDIEVQKDFLQQLNGDVALGDISYAYPENWTIPKLDSILLHLPNRNHQIRSAQSNIKGNEIKVKLEKLNNLPTMEAGYKSEAFLNQKLKGVHAGITIPLWQNKNRVTQAKLQYEYAQASYMQVESMVRTEVITLYNALQTMHSNYLSMKAILGEEQVTKNNYDLLQAREISFPEYLMEMNFIFESQTRLLETEKEIHILMSELISKTNI